MPDQQEPYLHEGVFGTGALYREPDSRDFDMRRLPGVQRALAAGLPDSDEHLRQHIVWTGNQGASPSCVWHTIAGIQSTNEHIERHGQVMIFDALRMHSLTGDPNQGRYTGDMLKIAQDQGTFLQGSSKRYRIGSYAFAPKNSQQEWVDTIKAAIMSDHICCLAMRLPSSFGWESSGSVLGWTTYHEVKLAGFRPGAWLIHNSWGTSWGRDGYGWVPLDLLFWNNWQEGAVFANSQIDGIDDDLGPPTPTPPTPTPPTPPTPTPPVAKRYIVTSTATGVGMDTLRQGTVLVGSGGGYTGNLAVTGVAVYNDTAPLPPNPLPPPNPPTPPPPTPGSLTVHGQRFRTGLFVTISDDHGPVIAVVTAKLNGLPLPTMGVNGNHGSSVTFNLQGGTGQVTMNAVSDDGRTGTGTANV